MRASAAFRARAHRTDRGFLGWLETFVCDSTVPPPSPLWTVHRDGEVVALALRRGPSAPLVLAACMRSAMRAVAARLAREQVALGSIVGNAVACNAFAEAWCVRERVAATLRFRIRNYELSSLRAPPRPNGHARTVRADEQALAIDWLLAFEAEARLVPDAERLRLRTPARIADGSLWWWDDGGPRAIAGHLGEGAEQKRIAPVYTPPAWRRRGYAGALLAAMIEHLQACGAHTIQLAADLANPDSNRLYAGLGFRPSGEQYQYDFVPITGA